MVPLHAEGLSAEAKYRLLLDLSRKVRGTLDLGETLDRLLDSVRAIVDYDAAGIFVLNEDVFAGHRRRELIAGVARRGFEERPPETDPMLSRGTGITGHVIRTGESVVARDVRLDPRYVVGRASTLSEIAVPITVGERTIGALNLESDRCGAFGEAQLEALRFFAEAAAVAIDKAMLHRSLLEKQQLEAQLRVAHQVQSRLLPQAPPSVDGYDVAAVYIPSWELAGDYYDFFRLPEGRLGLVIADVAGKGVPAALIMATFRALLRAQVASGAALAEIAARLNRLLRDDCRPHGFVTASCRARAGDRTADVRQLRPRAAAPRRGGRRRGGAERGGARSSASSRTPPTTRGRRRWSRGRPWCSSRTASARPARPTARSSGPGGFAPSFARLVARRGRGRRRDREAGARVHRLDRVRGRLHARPPGAARGRLTARRGRVRRHDDPPGARRTRSASGPFSPSARPSQSGSSSATAGRRRSPASCSRSSGECSA